jgi:hypothetical protein
VDPRAGVDDVERRKFLILLGLELQPLSRLACSQSLYRLCYPSSTSSPLGPNILPSPLFSKPITEMSNENLPGGKGRPAHKGDNLTAICELIV